MYIYKWMHINNIVYVHKYICVSNACACVRIYISIATEWTVLKLSYVCFLKLH